MVVLLILMNLNMTSNFVRNADNPKNYHYLTLELKNFFKIFTILRVFTMFRDFHNFFI